MRHANDHAMAEGVRQEINRSVVVDPFADNRPFSVMSVKNAN